MKNKKCLPNKEVAPKKRLVVYKKAIEYLKGKQKKLEAITCLHPEGGGLCLLLPTILWEISFLDNAPNGELWMCEHTNIMFPELKASHIKKITDTYTEPYQKTIELRIKYLTKYVEILEKDLVD
jgi:hypothetical protein